MFEMEYKQENSHWSNMDPLLKDFLGVSAAAATGALVGLVAGPVGALIGAIGGAIAGAVGLAALFFAHHPDHDRDKDYRQEQEVARETGLSRQDRIKCIHSYWEESNAYADIGQDPRYVTSNSYDGRYQGTPQNMAYPAGYYQQGYGPQGYPQQGYSPGAAAAGSGSTQTGACGR